MDNNTRMLGRRRRYFSESEKGNVIHTGTDEFNNVTGSPSRRFLENVMEKLHIKPKRSPTSINIMKATPQTQVNSLNIDLGFPPEEHESPPNVSLPLQRSLHNVIEEDCFKERTQSEYGVSVSLKDKSSKSTQNKTIATCFLKNNRIVKSQGLFVVFSPSKDQDNNEYQIKSNTSSDVQLYSHDSPIGNGELYVSCSNLLSEGSINDSDSNISQECSPTTNLDISQGTNLSIPFNISSSLARKRHSLAQKVKATFKGRNRAASLCTTTLLRDSSAERYNNMSEGVQITNTRKKSGSISGLPHSLKATNMMYFRPHQKSTEGLPEEIAHSPRAKGLLIKEVSL
uniref:Cmyb_C domain-containing protein n=1 Tax=Parastrongyloides trichosuri TaxID=131310 RepID=A0A0N5A1P8_PARTI